MPISRRALSAWSAITFALLSAPFAFAAAKPEAILAAAKKLSGDKAWLVDARIEADKQMKISGIIAGNDFDLTIEAVEGTKRQITVGGKSWLSQDGGPTWKEGDASDRRYYYLVHTPVTFSTAEKIPPHEIVPSREKETEPLLQVRFKAPDKISYEGDRPNWWILLENGKPTVIRRYHGPGVFEGGYVTTFATYTALNDQPAVVAPPGNPHAVAGEAGSETLLMAAMKKMDEGVWEVKGKATMSKTITLHGLLSGKDFDLTMEPEDGSSVIHSIVIKDKAWNSTDGGKSFHKGSPDDRLVYSLTHTPILSGRLEPPFEKVGTEQHDGATWLHIRLKVNEKTDEADLPQYWLLLDAAGQVQYIARASVPVVNPSTNSVIRTHFDYAPAKTAIAPPPNELMKSVGGEAEGPVTDRVYTFTELEKEKGNLPNKVVLLRVVPEVIMSEDRGDGSYRCMFKDRDASDGSFGYVIFPGEGLVKLGLLKEPAKGNHAWNELKKIRGNAKGPVTFYVQIVPGRNLGQVDLVALGSATSTGTNGSPGYHW